MSRKHKSWKTVESFLPGDSGEDEDPAPRVTRAHRDQDDGPATRPHNRVLVTCPDCAADLLIEALDPHEEIPAVSLTFLRHCK